MTLDNRFTLEMMGRHRFEEILREAERNRLLREAELGNQERLWERVLTWIAGSAHLATGAKAQTRT